MSTKALLTALFNIYIYIYIYRYIYTLHVSRTSVHVQAEREREKERVANTWFTNGFRKRIEQLLKKRAPPNNIPSLNSHVHSHSHCE